MAEEEACGGSTEEAWLGMVVVDAVADAELELGWGTTVGKQMQWVAGTYALFVSFIGGCFLLVYFKIHFGYGSVRDNCGVSLGVEDRASDK